MFGWLFGKKEKVQYEQCAPTAKVNHLSYVVSEPVHAIVGTFNEKGRWDLKIKPYSTESPILRGRIGWDVTDTLTGESYEVVSSYLYYLLSFNGIKLVPDRVLSESLPTWMTEEEQKYVASVVNNRMKAIEQRFKAVRDRDVEKSKVQAEVNKQKERQRLMGVYCNEK